MISLKRNASCVGSLKVFNNDKNMASQKYMQVPVNKIWVLEVFDKQLMCRGQARSGKILQLAVWIKKSPRSSHIVEFETRLVWEVGIQLSKWEARRPKLICMIFLKPNYYVNDKNSRCEMERTCWDPKFDGTLMEWFDPGFLEKPFLIWFYGGKKVCKIWQSIWERS